jgi:pimeloyl-ACP methyl ester carboxylesterase
MSRVRRAFAETANGQIHYREIPGPGPALVFLHQTSLSSRSWEPVMELFSGQFRVLAPDTPGYGDSTPPAERPTLEWYVEALRGWMEAIGLQRASFLGHHTGASLAAALATRYPDRVEKVVLSMPPLFTEEESAQYRGMSSAGAPIQEDGSTIMRVWNQQKRTNNERLSLDLAYWDTVESLKAWPRGIWAIQALAHADLAADLRGITQPALILHNTTDPLIRHWERLQAVVPGMRREVFETTTVDVFLEKADEVTPLLTKFLLGA